MTKEKRAADAPKQTGRGIGRNIERDYGDYRDSDDGKGSLRVGGDDESHHQTVQPASTDQSGSTGRPTGSGDAAQDGKDTGQGRYGQTGLGGTHSTETIGQESYRESDGDGDTETKANSNAGSGAAEHEDEEYRRNPGAQTPRHKPKE